MHHAQMDPTTQGPQHAMGAAPIHSTVLALLGKRHGRYDMQRLLGHPPVSPCATPSQPADFTHGGCATTRASSPYHCGLQFFEREPGG